MTTPATVATDQPRPAELAEFKGPLETKEQAAPDVSASATTEVLEEKTDPPDGLSERSEIHTHPGGDFVSEYGEYADVFEIPRKAHEWAAIQLLASAMNGRVFIPWGGTTYSLDFWMLVLSESGGGRNTMTSIVRGVANEAGIADLIHKAAWGSRIALLQQLSESPSGLYIWPEWGVVHKNFNDSRYAGMKEWFTNLYDEWHPPESIRYRTTGKKRDTPPIVFDSAPRTNIWATSSLDWFSANLGDGTDVTGGFLARFLPVVLPRSGRLVPKPRGLDAAKGASLAKKLKAAAELSGPATITADAEKLYNSYYESAHKRFAGHSNPSLAMPFFNRLKGQVLKLAVVFQVSETCSLEVSAAAMRRAIETAVDT